MNRLRLLSFDDLLLMKYLLDNMSLTSAASTLNLSQPAATQRIRKIESVFACKLFERSGRGIALTRDGRGICQKAAAAVSIMGETAGTVAHTVISVGTRAEVGLTWLWSAIASLRRSHPQFTLHVHFGSGEEIIRLLGNGGLDAVLTSAPVTLRDFDAVEVAKEDYLMVAVPEIARSIRRYEDLSKHVLLEHDRSFPFQRYIPADIRAQLRFSDVWFLGSSELMTRSVCDGFGVAIIPRYLAAPHLKKNRIKAVRLRLNLDHDYFRIIYSRQRNISSVVNPLAKALKELGLPNG
jgi:DNA-binding transcriptional LysR family regulator